MKTKQLGFTLIELVVVIVLLGIIGAVATARFQDLSSGAADATEQGVAGELASASAINFAARSLNPANGFAISGAAVDCDTVAGNILQTPLSADYTLTEADGDCTDGDGVECTVSHADGTATDATAPILCIN
jgi:MSHA pilin protein MshA